MCRMIAVLIGMLMQLYFDRSILDAENARVEQPAALLAALKSANPQVQRLAVRAIGRFERPELADQVRPLLSASDAGVRLEAFNALGQMNASFDLTNAVTEEKDGTVRSVIYETAGRLRETPASAEAILVSGLR